MNDISLALKTEEDMERYGEFLKWIQAVNYMAEDFYAVDEEGNLPVMDEVSIQAFRDSYQRASEECDRVLAAQGEGTAVK